MIFHIYDLLKYDHLAEIQRPLGLTSAGYHLMWIVWLTGPIEISNVATLMGASRPNVTGLTSTLTKEGLLTKRRSPSDARSSILALTDLGNEKFETAILLSSASAQSKFSSLTKTEFATLLRLLDKVAVCMAENSRPRVIENRDRVENV